MKSTALEILSEPLTLLLLLASLVLTVLAPVFHYHQFGEATRMARDAGLSALFTGGSVLAVFGTIRAFRREIESGTLEMALAHPVTRTGFCLAKTLGAFVSYLTFATVLFGTTVTIVNGAEIGGRLAERTGDLARIWGPCVAAGVAVILLPLILGACLNRFGRFRFVLTVLVTALITAVVSATVISVWSGSGWLGRLLPVAALLVIPAAVLLTAAAAFAVRFAAHAAASLSGLVAAGLLPFVGNYYLADALAKGGSVGWGYVALAFGAAVPALAAFLIFGGQNVERFDH